MSRASEDREDRRWHQRLPLKRGAALFVSLLPFTLVACGSDQKAPDGASLKDAKKVDASPKLEDAPKGWLAIRVGMSEAQVKWALGDPKSSDALLGNMTWHYDNHGYVMFNRAGVVDSWRPPGDPWKKTQ